MKDPHSRLVRISVFGIALAVAFAGCNNPPPTPPPTATTVVAPAPAPIPAPVVVVPPVVAPAATPAPATGQNTALIPVPQRGANYQTVHQKLVQLAHAGGIDVMFLGDSITDFWTGVSSGRATGQAVWDANFKPLKAADFGYNADRTQNVLWRLQNGEGEGFMPKVIVLMIGTNNTGVESRTAANSPPRNSIPQTVEGVTAVVQELRKRFADSKILLLGIFPRVDNDPLARSQIPVVNQALAKLDDQQHIFFLDIGAKFLDANGDIPKDIMADGLHPTAKGYQIWADAIKEPLAKLLQ